MDKFEQSKDNIEKLKDEVLADTINRLKRDHDSLDDFEHLEHDTSPIHETKDMAAKSQDLMSAQLVDLPRAISGEFHPVSIDKHEGINSQRSLLDSSLPADERNLQPVPATATPPPSGNFAKLTLDDVLDKPINDVRDILGEIGSAQAQDSKPFQHFNPASALPQVDPKAASLAFMDGERSREAYHIPELQPRAVKQVVDDHQREDKSADKNREQLEQGVTIKDKASPGGGAKGVSAGDLTSELQRALEAQVAEAKAGSVKKSESVEEVFEDLAQAALKMPEVQDIIDPKEDLFGLEDAANDQRSGPKVMDRNTFGQEHDSYGQVNKPDITDLTRENSAQLLGTLDFESAALKTTAKKPEDADFLGDIKSSVLPEPQKSPEIDFLKDEIVGQVEPKGTATAAQKHGQQQQQPFEDDSWNVVEKPADKFEKCEPLEKFGEREPTPEPPNKSLPPIPRDASPEPISIGTPEPFESYPSFPPNKSSAAAATAAPGYEFSNDFIATESVGQNKFLQAGAETGDSEFESEPESCPLLPPSRAAHAEPATKTEPAPKKQERGTTAAAGMCYRKDPVEEIAPKEIFREMGLDAWFNPERLNPKVEALIYWRDPKKSGIVFGAILGVLLSLAYFSLISVLAYLSLIILTGTVAFRIYKTVLQAVQKTADGHPFKDVLDVDLTLPAEKVHDVADVAVAHANAAVAELRRLFLVEDLVDSLKFGVLLWCLTYLGAWFNGMTLIIIGVVALFSLPKVYETNKTQIDQNLDLVRGKINDLTAKVKAAIPLGKKTEPTKEE